MSANLEVFDISRKGQVKKIYSFEEVLGGRIIVNFLFIHHFLVTGNGDVAYNPRRNTLGAISVEGKINYHLYNFTTSKAGNIVKLIRKSKWQSKYTDEEGNQ